MGTTLLGEVVKLDRGFPLVELECGERLRCEHAASLQKSGDTRACIGDRVEVALPDAHDMGVIESIAERRSVLARKDPTDRAIAQIMAANFDKVLIVQPLDRFNPTRLQRELVMAHQSGAEVGVLLTKADLLDRAEVARIADQVRNLAGSGVSVMAISARPERIEGAPAADQSGSAIIVLEGSRAHGIEGAFPPGTTTILLGSSGAGKSSLINALLGQERQLVSDVRAQDGKGRHTTVSREVVPLPNGGRIVDMPGIRGVGLWDADVGIARAFADVEELAQGCRFRDCTHGSEPGCAVRAAVEEGVLGQARLDYYRELKEEEHGIAKRRERARWSNKR